MQKSEEIDMKWRQCQKMRNQKKKFAKSRNLCCEELLSTMLCCVARLLAEAIYRRAKGVVIGGIFVLSQGIAADDAMGEPPCTREESTSTLQMMA